MPTNIQKPLFRNGNGKCVLVDMKNKKNTQEKYWHLKAIFGRGKPALRGLRTTKKLTYRKRSQNGESNQ